MRSTCVQSANNLRTVACKVCVETWVVTHTVRRASRGVGTNTRSFHTFIDYWTTRLSTPIFSVITPTVRHFSPLSTAPTTSITIFKKERNL